MCKNFTLSELLPFEHFREEAGHCRQLIEGAFLYKGALVHDVDFIRSS